LKIYHLATPLFGQIEVDTGTWLHQILLSYTASSFLCLRVPPDWKFVFWKVCRNMEWQTCSLSSKRLDNESLQDKPTKTRVARFILMQHTKTGKNIPNDHILYKMAVKYARLPWNRPNGNNMYKHFPVQDIPKFTQIGISGLKIYIPSGNPNQDKWKRKVFDELF
jgi:hypothetical protein